MEVLQSCASTHHPYSFSLAPPIPPLRPAPSLPLRPSQQGPPASVVHLCVNAKDHFQLRRPVLARSSAADLSQETAQNEDFNKLIKSLQDVEILDMEGNSIRLTDLWKTRKVVIGFTRHFGCVLCMKRADLLASQKTEMDVAGAALVVIGPGNVDQARAFKKDRKFPGEVYADPNYSAYKALEFVAGVTKTFTPTAGMKIISLYMEGYRQDWELSFEKNTRTKGGWQQGGILVAGPGVDNISFLFKDADAGDEPKMEDVMAACCAT